MEYVELEMGSLRDCCFCFVFFLCGVGFVGEEVVEVGEDFLVLFGSVG